jgi:hypothetical protein
VEAEPKIPQNPQENRGCGSIVWYIVFDPVVVVLGYGLLLPQVLMPWILGNVRKRIKGNVSVICGAIS